MKKDTLITVAAVGAGAAALWWLTRESRSGAIVPSSMSTATPTGLVPEPTPLPSPTLASESRSGAIVPSSMSTATPTGLVPEPTPLPSPTLASKVYTYIGKLDLYASTKIRSHLEDAKAMLPEILSEGAGLTKADVLTEDIVDRLLSRYNVWRRKPRVNGLWVNVDTLDYVEVTDRTTGTTQRFGTGTREMIDSLMGARPASLSTQRSFSDPVPLGAFCTGLLSIVESVGGTVEWLALPAYTETPGRFLTKTGKLLYYEKFTTDIPWAGMWMLRFGRLVGHGRRGRSQSYSHTEYTSAVRAVLNPTDRAYVMSRYGEGPWSYSWLFAATDRLTKTRREYKPLAGIDLRSMLSNVPFTTLVSWFKTRSQSIVGGGTKTVFLPAVNPDAPEWLRASPDLIKLIYNALSNVESDYTAAMRDDLIRLGTYYNVGSN